MNNSESGIKHKLNLDLLLKHKLVIKIRKSEGVFLFQDESCLKSSILMTLQVTPIRKIELMISCCLNCRQIVHENIVSRTL
jgi:hypothetical protein